MPDKYLILGIGNLLLGDEGVGIHAIGALEKEALPDWVHLKDGGTGGFALLETLNEYNRIILIDAVEMGESPGTVRRIQPDEISSPESHLGVSAHGFNFAHVLEMSKTLYGSVPDITIIGVQPKAVEYIDRLSPEVENSIEKIKQIVLDEIAVYQHGRMGK